jgi:hypothetical protein
MIDLMADECLLYIRIPQHATKTRLLLDSEHERGASTPTSHNDFVSAGGRTGAECKTKPAGDHQEQERARMWRYIYSLPMKDIAINMIASTPMNH